MRRAAQRIRVHPAGEGIRRSTQVRLASLAQWSPDEKEREAAQHALRILTEHEWQDSGWKVLGFSPKQPPAPVVLGAVRLGGEEGVAA